MRNRRQGILLTKKVITKAPKTRGGGTKISRSDNVYHSFPNKNDTLKICIIRSLGGIGDVLMTTPAVRQLKEDYPNSHITYAMDRHSTKDYYELLKNAPFIDEIVDARYINRAQYSSVTDITSVCIKYENANQRPLNRIDIFAKACGIPRLRNHLPFYKEELLETQYVSNVLNTINQKDKKLVFLHTASFDSKRCWPAYRYEELLDLAAQERPDIHFLVSDYNNVLPDKTKYSNITNITNSNIRYIASFISQSDFFIGPDSGPMHIAGAVGTPSLALFGSISPEARINYYPTHQAIISEPKLSCQFCIYAKCNINYKCMSNITAKQVLQRLKVKLNE